MSEINAFMNGYKPEDDNEFLAASLEAHKKALVEANLETETAKEFLYQHIQTNKELEKKVELFEKALKEIMDLGITYASTTHEHHSCAEGMYRIAELTLDHADPSETHAATHPEMYFEK
jgi:CRISPR/Cas system CSM-associated protein Csm2 small subunit